MDIEKKQHSPRGKVLFVDDEQNIINSVEMFLKYIGYEAFITTSSQRAFDEFEKAPQSFSLVITDLNMPEMTGIELSKKIRKISPHIPIVLCSGSIEDINSIKTEEAGINEIVPKPYKLRSDLAEILKKYS